MLPRPHHALVFVVALLGGCFTDTNVDELCQPSDPACAEFDYDGDGVVNAVDPWPEDGRCNAYSAANCTACGVGCEARQTCTTSGSCVCENALKAFPQCDTCLADGFVGEACAECAPNRYPAGSCDVFCEAETTCNGQGTCADNGTCLCDACFDGPTCAEVRVEVCNGVDDNCDGQTDEGLGQTTCGQGVCAQVVDTCADGVAQSCDAMEGASEEVCNGLDDDCDGQTDEGTSSAPCEAVNQWGSCEGAESCQGESGLVCDAPQPAEEGCDGLDNDCDGQTDEGFEDTDADGAADCVDADDDNDGTVDDDDCDPLNPAIHPGAIEQCSGVNEDCDGQTDEDFTDVAGDWTLDGHCGGCGMDCADLFDHGVGACGGPSDAPVCVVESCDPGYLEVNDALCMPTVVLCDACATDSDCLGGSCTPIDGQMACLVPCDVEAPACPDGYVCSGNASETALCVPSNGTCSCTEGNVGAKRPCVEENAVGTCFGFETCELSLGWGGCTASVPAEDVCDGVDNDCDGLIDDGADALCADDDACGETTCAGAEGCLYFPYECDDDVFCTADSCDPVSGCVFTPVHAMCDDGVACTLDSCNPEAGCSHTPEDALCDDGDVCTGTETCDATLDCQPGVELVCDDDDVCTVDACDAATGCSYVVVPCDDGNVCTTDSCFTGFCFHAPVSCDDGVGCTVDSCDADLGCVLTPDAEVCADENTCTTDSCDVTDGCVYVAADGQMCNDEDVCTLNDWCVDSLCVGTPVECDDGDVCNGAETCDGDSGVCASGTALTCDDDDACTADVCDAVDGCVHTEITEGECAEVSCDDPPCIGASFPDWELADKQTGDAFDTVYGLDAFDAKVLVVVLLSAS